MRYTPSFTATLCIIIIASALAANFLIINPGYDAALANHRVLKAQLNAAQEQQRKPLSDDQKKLAARLQTPADAKLLIDNLTQFRNAAHLGDITYSISPFTQQENGLAIQRIELTVTSATDVSVWPFLQMAEDDARPMLRTETLQISRTPDGVQTTATLINYRWSEE